MEFVTDANVGYDWWLSGPGGASFALHPLVGRHTQEDVERAKNQIRQDHDVVSMHVEWVKSYNGELFRTHRQYVDYLNGLKKQVLEALGEDNRQKFLSFTISEQRYTIWRLIDEGMFKWTIGARR